VQQKQAGILTDYDFEAPTQLPVWVSFLPYILVIVIMVVVWWLFISRASSKGTSSRDVRWRLRRTGRTDEFVQQGADEARVR